MSGGHRVREGHETQVDTVPTKALGLQGRPKYILKQLPPPKGSMRPCRMAQGTRTEPERTPVRVKAGPDRRLLYNPEQNSSWWLH